MTTEIEWVMTDDGSPTLKWQGKEWMHNRKSALSESLYIYFDAVQFAEKYQWPANYLSVGLGLGYIEMIIAAYWAQRGQTTNAPYLESFEREPLLVENLMSWLRAEPCPWESQYDVISAEIGKKFTVSRDVIRNTLLNWMENHHWVIRGELDIKTSFDRKFTCIFYDAFSSNTNPELWDDQTLQQIIQSAAGPQCILSTFAATGAMNRELKNHGFILEDRPGFAGKRQSTFAVRNV